MKKNCILKVTEEGVGSGVEAGSGSISQRYECAHPDLYPDPHQNVTDP
jgi:hypothetical protein